MEKKSLQTLGRQWGERTSLIKAHVNEQIDHVDCLLASLILLCLLREHDQRDNDTESVPGWL